MNCGFYGTFQLESGFDNQNVRVYPPMDPLLNLLPRDNLISLISPTTLLKTDVLLLLSILAMAMPGRADELNEPQAKPAPKFAASQKSPYKDFLLKGSLQQSAFFDIPPTSLAKPKSFEAGVWNKLWQTYSQAGRNAYAKKNYEEAEAMYRGAVEQAQKFAPGDRRLGISLTNLAATLRDEGKYQESQAIFLRAIAEKERWLQPSDPTLATTLKHYAYLLRKLGKGTEAKISEQKADTIIAIANHRGLSLAKSRPVSSAFLADDIFQDNQSGKTKEKDSDKASWSASHRITRLCTVLKHERPASEPVTIIRINALILAGGIINGAGGGAGQVRTFIGAPQVTQFGHSQASTSYLDAQIVELASKYGIADDTIEAITAPGGELVEIDNNRLFYVCCPINRHHWQIGTIVSITKMNELLYLLQSQDEGYRLLVKELAGL
jgi:tetratricopeptide (TPR) repeat protein